MNVSIKDTDRLQAIRSKIYEIRGWQVMLDFDLAELFPSDFMFKLTKEEFEFLRSQIVISKGRGRTVICSLHLQNEGLPCFLR